MSGTPSGYIFYSYGRYGTSKPKYGNFSNKFASVLFTAWKKEPNTKLHVDFIAQTKPISNTLEFSVSKNSLGPYTYNVSTLYTNNVITG